MLIKSIQIRECQHNSTQINTSQHESDTNQHEFNMSQYEPDMSQLDQETIIVYRSFSW